MLVLLLACAPAPAPAPDEPRLADEADTDTDADSDTDADTDTDADSDTGPLPTGDTGEPVTDACTASVAPALESAEPYTQAPVSPTGSRFVLGQWKGPGLLCEVDCVTTFSGAAFQVGFALEPVACAPLPSLELGAGEVGYLCLRTPDGQAGSATCSVRTAAEVVVFEVVVYTP